MQETETVTNPEFDTFLTTAISTKYTESKSNARHIEYRPLDLIPVLPFSLGQ